MSYMSRTVANADGTQTAYPVSFPFQSRAEVAVYVHPASTADVGVAKVAGVDFNWTSNGLITFVAGHVPAAGQVVDIRRGTFVTALDNTLASGGSLRTTDLVQNDTQLLYLDQELKDADADLQAQMLAEVAARVGADAAEATARAAADGAEASARVAGDNSLLSLLNAKADKSAISLLAALVSTGGLPSGVTVGVSPEQFGAVGDGGTNDTQAFQQLAIYINALGGGTVVLRPGAVYLVGKQDLINAGGWMWKGQDIFTLSYLTRPITIIGNGAKIILAAGLKFGTFDAAGNATTHAMPYSGGDLSAPCPAGIITITDCASTAPVRIENLEVNGNRFNLALGGQFGDVGWQVPGDGLFLQRNAGGEFLTNVTAPLCPRDGFQVLGGGAPITAATPRVGSVWTGCKAPFAGRNGMSFTGGRGYTFIGCGWTDAGTGAWGSPPSAGVDLEAEVGAIRDLHFIDSEFAYGAGSAMVSGSGDVAKVTFDGCRFINPHSWAAWLAKPKFVFNNCLFAGANNFAFTGMAVSDQPHFTDCEFTDDVAYLRAGDTFDSGYVMFNGSRLWAKFDRCKIHAMHTMSLGSETGIYGVFEDCAWEMGAVGGGIFALRTQGHNEFTAATPFGLMFFEDGTLGGSITYNGTVARMGQSIAYNPPSVAAGAAFSTVVSVPLASLNDNVRVHFTQAHTGISFAESYVSTGGSEAGLNGQVTVIGRNVTGAAIDLPAGDLTVTVTGRYVQ